MKVIWIISLILVVAIFLGITVWYMWKGKKEGYINERLKEIYEVSSSRSSRNKYFSTRNAAVKYCNMNNIKDCSIKKMIDIFNIDAFYFTDPRNQSIKFTLGYGTAKQYCDSLGVDHSSIKRNK